MEGGEDEGMSDSSRSVGSLFWYHWDNELQGGSRGELERWRANTYHGWRRTRTVTSAVMQTEISSVHWNIGGDVNRTGRGIKKKNNEDPKHPQILRHHLPHAGFLPRLPQHFTTGSQTEAELWLGSRIGPESDVKETRVTETNLFISVILLTHSVVLTFI